MGHAFLDQDFEDVRHVIDTTITSTRDDVVGIFDFGPPVRREGAIVMVQQDDTSRSGVGPFLGVLGVSGLTIAFVTLRGSKRRQGDETRYKRKALATYLRDHLAGADTAIQMVQGLRTAYRSNPEGALFESLYEQFREDRAAVEALLAELGLSGVSQTTGGSCDRHRPSCGGWRHARRSVAVADARGACHRRAR